MQKGRKNKFVFNAILLMAAFAFLALPALAAPALNIGSTSYSGTDNLIYGHAGGTTGNILKLLSNTSGSDFVITSLGNVGIGTTAPTQKLELVGTLKATAFTGAMTGSLSSTYVSAGDFGSLTGGGNYSFPGNLGIGTTAPMSPLEIKKAGIWLMELTASGTSGSSWFLSATDSGFSSGAGKLVINNVADSANAKFVIDSNGNVGINTTAPTAKLDVSGSLKIQPATGNKLIAYNVPILEGGATGVTRVFRNLANYESNSSAQLGAIVINTGITSPINAMSIVHLRGYEYNSTVGPGNVIDLDVASYFNGPTWTNRSYVNHGSVIPTNVQIGTNAAGQIVIVIGSTTDSWSYPKLWVESWFQSHTSTADSDADNWSISIETDLSAYTLAAVGHEGLSLQGGAMSGTLNMQNNIITNIGNAGTDFTATGGLTLTGGIYGLSWTNTASGYTYADSGGAGIANANPYTGGALLYLTGNAFSFYNGSSRNVVISSNGNVGIATTAPTQKLEVVGTIKATAFTGALTGSLSSTYVSAGDFGALTGGGNYSFPGNLGIGLTAPATRLHINGSTTNDAITIGGTANTSYSGVNFDTDETGEAWIFAVGSAYEAWSLTGALNVYNASGPIAFQTGGSNNRMVIDAAGNVGIGTTNPGATLDVNGIARVNGNYLRVQNSGVSNTGYIDFGNADAYLGFQSGSTFNIQRWDGVDYYEAIRIDGSNHRTLLSPTEGSVGIGTTAPGAKFHVVNSAVQTGVYSYNTYVGNHAYGVDAEAQGVNPSYSNFGVYAVARNGGSNYAIYVPSGYPAAGINNYQLYLASDAKSYFGGNVGIGANDPGTKLQIYQPARNTDALIIHTSVTNSDGAQGYGAISFQEYAGKNANYSQIRSWSNLYSMWGSQLSFHVTNTAGSPTLIEAMRINYYGNVGIATTTPTQKLEVVGTVKATAFIGAMTGSLSSSYVSAGDFGSVVGGGIYSFPSNVGIGLTNPTYKLHVSGNGFFSSTLTANNGLTVAGTLSLPASSVTDAMVSDTLTASNLVAASSVVSNAEVDDTLTISGGAIGSNTIGAGSVWTTAGTLTIGDNGDALVLSATNVDLTSAGNLFAAGGISTYDTTVTDNYVETGGLCLGNGTNCITSWTNVGGSMNASSPTANYVAKFSDADTIANSLIYDNATNVGIGLAAPTAKLHILGAGAATLNLETSDVYSTPPSVTINAILKYSAAGATTNMGKIVFAKNNATDADTGAYTAFYRKGSGETIAEAMRIDPLGNVGIGLTNPTYKLHVSGNGFFSSTLTANNGLTVAGTLSLPASSVTDAMVSDTLTASNLVAASSVVSNAEVDDTLTISGGSIGSNTIGAGSVWTTAGTLTIGDNGDALVLSATNVDLTSAGNLFAAGGISTYDTTVTDNYVETGGLCLGNGTNCITSWTNVGGSMNASSPTANYVTKFLDTDTIMNSVIYDNGTNVGIGLTNPTTKLYVSGDVTATSFLYSSDINLKKNIENIDSVSALEKIKQLQGVSFNWKDESLGGRTKLGLIAQEVEKVVPELVYTDSNNLKSVEYGNVVALLIEAIKEQQKEIDSLKELAAPSDCNVDKYLTGYILDYTKIR